MKLQPGCAALPGHSPFSILERIELGETGIRDGQSRQQNVLSVSSNGSNWVKHVDGASIGVPGCFQYPRTDRIG